MLQNLASYQNISQAMLQRLASGQISEHLPKQTPMFTGTLIIETLIPAWASHTARTLLSQLDLSFSHLGW